MALIVRSGFTILFVYLLLSGPVTVVSGFCTGTATYGELMMCVATEAAKEAVKGVALGVASFAMEVVAESFKGSGNT